MPVKRYFATKDNSITNAYKSNLTTRATSSNMGLADVLEIFTIYGQVSTSSVESMRAIVQFDIEQILSDRNAGLIPASGSVDFYVRMFNAPHGYSVPRNYDMQLYAVSQSWDEGSGLDMEEFSDIGQSSWASASSTTAWDTAGGDIHASPVYTQSFGQYGIEDLEVDITGLVEEWLAGTKENDGILIKLSGSLDTSPTRSYYTKKFFSRSSEFFFKRPIIEARFDNSILDNRGNFFYSSSLATAEENLQTVYLYNYFRGTLRNIPDIGTGNIYVSIFSGSTTPAGAAINLVADGTNVVSPNVTVVTGGYVSTGVYSASFAMTAAATPLETIFDIWHNGDLTTQYHTGTIEPQLLTLSQINNSIRYTTSITNLKPIYMRGQTERFRVFARERNWNPNIYTRASVTTPSPYIIESGSYRVFRIIDELEAIEYGTGSSNHTRLSYDLSGNYFDLDIDLLEAGYAYGIKFAFYNDSVQSYEEQPEVFKFRVEQ